MKSRRELDDMSERACLHWLAWNDPNGEWKTYLDEPTWARVKLGELNPEELRDELWQQMQG